MEKINSVLTRKKCFKMAWYSMHVGFWMCQLQWHRFWDCTFRWLQVMGYMYALPLKLLITGLLFEYFATLLKILHLKKKGRICSIFLHQLYFFLWEGQGHFWDKDQISSWEGKRKGKMGYGGEAQNEGYFCKIPIIKQDTNFISQTFGQTNFSPPLLQLA